MSTTNILDLNNRIDALEKIAHNVEPIQQQIDELKAWTDSGTKDASGNPIILTDGAAFKAVDLKVSLSPKQRGSGTPSPDNVRPITGYTECVVDRDGENLLPNGTADSTDKGIEFTRNSDGSVSVVGTNDGTGASIYVLVYQMRLLAGEYTLTGGISSNVTVAVRDGDVIGPAFATDTGRGATFTLASDSNVGVVIRVVSGTANINTKVYPMICLSNASNSPVFAPYSHFNATITFGQTVYGGSVDFKSGKVMVTHASIASYNGESINEPWLSSIDEYVSGATPTTGAQVVYPLTTPTELTLTPAELELLKGYNYITTNGDNIELTYQPDTLKADILLTVSQLYGSKISIMDGILTGGTTGQVLTKTSDDNYDATWETLPATRTTTKKSEK